MSLITPGLLVHAVKTRRRPASAKLLLRKLDDLKASPSLPPDKADELTAVINCMRKPTTKEKML